MNIWEMLLLAVGLAMDAFAAAICKGLTLRRPTVPQALTVGLFFGGFQALMPFLGWLLGRQFEAAISAFDHWVVFILLTLIGGKMIWEAFHPENIKGEAGDKLHLRELLMLSVATSIDALAAGITFALVPNTNVPLSIALIGLITFALSSIGVMLGSTLGRRFEKGASIAGGVILILIGIKTVCDHLFER